MHFRNGQDVIEFREKFGMKRVTFWKWVDVLPETGATFERGRPIPATTRMLLTIAYGTVAQARSLVSSLRGEGAWQDAKALPKAVIRFTDPAEVRALRKSRGASQPAFWGAIKLERSRGAHYEIGTHPIPEAIGSLLTLTFGSNEEAAALYTAIRDKGARALAGEAPPDPSKERRLAPHLFRFRTGADVVAFRKERGLSVADVWCTSDVLRSIGSHLELEQDLPVPVQVILTLMHGTQAHAATLVTALRREDGWRLARPLPRPVVRFATATEVRAFREKRKLSQGAFWRTIDLQQSRGCRYEADSHTNRAIPLDVQYVLTIAFGTGEEAATLLHALRLPRSTLELAVIN